jgi:hypothetical protein
MATNSQIEILRKTYEALDLVVSIMITRLTKIDEGDGPSSAEAQEAAILAHTLQQIELTIRSKR